MDFKVSVVIPAHNEEESIAGVLSALGNQDYPDLEIIVVNDCSTDRTKENIADMVLSGGMIYTVDEQNPQAEAVAHIASS